MKSNEFKKILKPLIEQAVRDVLLEEGVLSSVVSEVAKGLSGNLVTEGGKKEQLHKEVEYEKQRQERIKRLDESTKISGVFEGTQELKEASRSPLSGVSSADSGVDITDIQKLASGKWKALMGGK